MARERHRRRFGIPAGLSLPGLEQALDQHPSAVGARLRANRAISAPSVDVPAIVELAHAHDVPVVVDQAWGAHFGFPEGCPEHAMAAGADAMVISAHKTLPAFSQASLLLARTERLAPDRLERSFDSGHTTSPSGAILTSVDASRALLASDFGRGLLTALAVRTARLRTTLRATGLPVPGPEDFPGRFDPAKVVLLTAASGRSGLDLEQAMLAAGIGVEMADRDTVVPLATMLDDDAAFEHLRRPWSTRWAGTAATRARCRRRASGAASRRSGARRGRHSSPTARRCPSTTRSGRISAELIAPYPPGVPVLVPGEEVTADALARLRAAGSAGLRIAYAADPTLTTVQVLLDGRQEDVGEGPA